MGTCYGVDLDGTLAEYHGWKGSSHIGDPIPKMIERVLGWIDEGIEIIIFTARAQAPKNIPYIKDWLRENGLPDLEVTNRKLSKMSRIYDDRAVQIERNTGKILSRPNLIEEFLKRVQNTER